MLQTLDQIFTPNPVASSPGRTWEAIPDFVASEVAKGRISRSTATKTVSAANGLLKAVSLTPENGPLDLDWFDRTFLLKGWDPATMPFEQSTYRDYRNRVRPVIERILGADVEKKALRCREDDWKDAVAFLRTLDRFQDPSGLRSLIPIQHTLTNFGRCAGILALELDQKRLMKLYDDAGGNEKRSLRSASRLIADLQATVPAVLTWFPHPITPIEAEGPFRYVVPNQFQTGIEDFVECASRKKYLKVKKKYEYVSKGTRTNFRTTLHATIDGLIRTGHLRNDANDFASVLKNTDALDDLLNHVVERVESGEIKARHATTLMGRLPTMLDRNGIDSRHLREAIAEFEELKQHADKTGMAVSAMRLCRKLIENRAFRNRFLLAHAKPRQIAQSILDMTTAEGRPLTATERGAVIRHGVVALFCAIEIGGAPVRVENVLEMPYGGEDAWMRAKGKGYEVVIPAGFVKNNEKIEFEMQQTLHKWSDTVKWYLRHVRPLILKDPGMSEIRSSRWLVPMLSDSARPCPYETFLDWFTRIMRDVVGVPCLPHNYRHGQASLLYHRYPHKIAWIARRLGDTEKTILEHYAWVHNQKVMAEGQHLICKLIES